MNLQKKNIIMHLIGEKADQKEKRKGKRAG